MITLGMLLISSDLNIDLSQNQLKKFCIFLMFLFTSFQTLCPAPRYDPLQTMMATSQVTLHEVLEDTETRHSTR